MQFSRRRPALRCFAVAMALTGMLSSASMAAEISISCPQTDMVPELNLRLSDATLVVSDADGAAELPAKLNGDPSAMFTIDATGPIEGPLPPLAELEACVSDKLAQQGALATDPDALAFVLNQCRIKLGAEAVRQPIEASFTLTSLEAGSVSLLISRRYIAPSALTGAALQLDEWPMRQCKVM